MDPLPLIQIGPDAAEFRRAMRLPTSTVAILTAGAPGARVGVTITAACSLSDSPPSVLACLHGQSAALATVRALGAFGLSFLAHDQQDLAEVFAGRSGLKGEARFASGVWHSPAGRAPLLEGALAAFECDLLAELPSPTHAVLLGRVLGQTLQEASRALLYAQGRFAALPEMTV